MAISVTSGSGPTIKTARVSTGNIMGAAEANVSVTWDSPFPDGNYTVSAQVGLDEAGEALRVRRVRTVTAAGCVVNVVNNGLSIQTGTVHAIAVGD